MSPPRRRSARLAVSTPKPAKQAPLLASLSESDEPASDALESSKMKELPPTPRVPRTPTASSPIRPPREEMHPSKAHGTMQPPSSGLRLGFADMKSAMIAKTPSKTSNPPPSSPFQLPLTSHVADFGLSSEALKMMDELRGEALKIKASMVAQKEKEDTEEAGRRFAKPKGRTGRFSAAHMAEFKKMDSIEGHPSAFRAAPGRVPAPSSAAGIKRSPSKANLDTPAGPPRSALKRSPSKASLDDPDPASPTKQAPAKSSTKAARGDVEPPSPAKRAKQRMEDDATSSRPISRDGSFIPRPKSSGNDGAPRTMARSQSNLAHLMSPTKASMARSAAAAAAATPAPPAGGGLKKSSTTYNVAGESSAAAAKRRVLSPKRLDKVKAMFRSPKVAEKPKSGIPQPGGVPQTPSAASLDKPLPPAPLTSPRRKLVKRTDYAPAKNGVGFAASAASPSPMRFTLRKSGSIKRAGSEVHYPSLDSVVKAKDSVTYPDLSKHLSPASPAQPPSPCPEPSVPGTFTFRSDHTIEFGGTSPNGFGGRRGQSSLRHVRQSLMPGSKMPGSFPESHPNKEDKENQEPRQIPHGIQNKKRHRPTWDEEEAEEAERAEERAAKKQKSSHAGGDGLFGVKLVNATPATPKAVRSAAQVPHTTSPSRRRRLPISLTRLNMLAQPKRR